MDANSLTYHSKLQECKIRQQEITSEMEAHVNADETCIITEKAVLDLTNSSLELDRKRLLVTQHEPFLILCAHSHQPLRLQAYPR